MMDIRRLAWKAGTPVGTKQRRIELGKIQAREMAVEATASIITSLGIMSPTAAVRWEIDRRRLRKATAAKRKQRVSQLPKVFVGDGTAHKKGPHREAALGKRSSLRKDSSRQCWDVH